MRLKANSFKTIYVTDESEQEGSSPSTEDEVEGAGRRTQPGRGGRARIRIQDSSSEEVAPTVERRRGGRGSRKGKL